MKLTTGIIGLPNVGKSTIFNALCAGKAAAENFPFCTIDPNHGVAAVPDERLTRISTLLPTQKVVPAFLELIDIAGLVKGASKGEGLGNQFLGHIKEVEAVVHVVRCFEDDNIVHVDGSIDPLRDIGTVETELLIKDTETVEQAIFRIAKAAKSGEKDLKEKSALFERVHNALQTGVPARRVFNTCEEQDACSELHLLTAKPVLYVANVDEGGMNGNQFVSSVKLYAEENDAECVTICGKVEAEIAELDLHDRKEFLESLRLKESGLHILTRAIFRLLGLQTFFTASEKQNTAWIIPRGVTAPRAAGMIHGDFEKGFIKADVYKIEDLEQYGSEQALRSAGKIRSEGREYVVQDGDILFIKFSPTV